MRKPEKGRSDRAKILEIFRIERSDSIRLRSAAAAAGKRPGTLTREVLLNWLDRQELENSEKSVA